MNDDDVVVSGASGCEAVEELRRSGALDALCRARVRVQACETLAAHRRGDRPHPHIHTRTRQSMVDARSSIGTTRDLILPGHRLIQTPPRHRALGALAHAALPRVIACARDT